MSVELKVPEVGESVREVQIGAWRKADGDLVNQDEGVVEIETDKAAMELPAPAAGRLSIRKQKGEVVNVGDVIAVIDDSVTVGEAAVVPSQTTAPSDTRKVSETPPARERPGSPEAARAGVSQEAVIPSVQASAIEPTKEPAPAVEPQKIQPVLTGPRHEEAVPMSMLRRRVAQRLVEASQTTAMLTTFNEIDCSAMAVFRMAHSEAFEKKYGIRLGIMSFFVKASIDALKLYPQVNAEIRGNDIIYKNYYDIGVAVATDRGLVVPVLRNAELMSFAQVEQAIADMGKKARENKLTIEEIEGGTFTISNGGVFGSLLSTPILNPPQSGILGMHTIQDRPVVVDGQIVVRPMMYIALTYDHRLVDGREAVGFLRRIKDCIETPARMLLEA